MPRKCSVFGCKSNYKSQTERTTIFSLPSDENRRKVWLRHIPTDFSEQKQPGVCIKHFDESFVIREDKIMDRGELKIFPRVIPKLTDDAVPTIFPNTPSYCSKKVSKIKRLADVEEDNMQKAIQESVETHQSYLQQDTLDSLADITSHLENRNINSNVWSVINDDDKMYLCLLGLDRGVPYVTSFITINSDLSYNLNVKTGTNKIVIKASSDNSKRLNSVNTLDNIMLQMEKEEIVPNEKSKLECATQCLQSTSNYEENEFLKFCVEQLNLSQKPKNNRYYGNKTMILACCLYVHSVSAYNALRKCALIFLPHPRTLQKFICNYKLASSPLESCQYLKNRVKYLKPHELLVSLLMDEIYVQPQISFKCGEIYGSSVFDAETCAKTALVYMVSSLLSKYVDVVAIVPVANITAEQLKTFTENVLTMVESTGFKVVSLIADNNSVNRKAYELFTPNKTLQASIVHPLDSSRKLFFMFDTVHMLKSIRNNWETKRNVNKTLHFPDMTNHSVMLSAQYKHMELLYEKEKNSLVKYGHTLSSKVLYPSSIQKQNVKIALRLFNDNNAVALKHASKDLPDISEEINQTSIFLQIIVNWWKIVNVKSVFEAQRFNDPYREAIRVTSVNQLKFLTDMLHWLKIWRLSVPSNVALTAQTFQSLILTTESFLEVIPYLFGKYKIDYILLAKFQSDNLESRFGSYRQLSGANYYISYIQVLENERKLRFKNDVLFAANSGNVHLKTLIPVRQSKDQNIDLHVFSDIMNLSFKIGDIPSDTLPILTYIGGYAVMKALRKCKCDTCTAWLQLDGEIEVDSSYDFVKELDRGRLTLPSEEAVFTVALVWHTVSLLVGKYLKQFMTCGKQLSVAHNLSFRRLVNSTVIDAKCKCLLYNTLLCKLEYISVCTSKILLNNFEKMCNDKGTDFKGKSRTLKKFKSGTST